MHQFANYPWKSKIQLVYVQLLLVIQDLLLEQPNFHQPTIITYQNMRKESPTTYFIKRHIAINYYTKLY